MTEQQRQELIDFTPNFVRLLHEAGFSRGQAAEAVHSALACLFAVVWKVPADITLTEEEREFLLSVQLAALSLFYKESEAQA